MLVISRDVEPPFVRAPDAIEFAQPLDAIEPGGNTLTRQLGLNLPRLIAALSDVHELT